MNKTYENIYEHVEELSYQLNTMFLVDPKILIVITNNETTNGSFVAMYRKKDMYIEIRLPQKFTFGAKHKNLVSIILMHEYCHYFEGIKMKASNRTKSANRYEADQQYRKAEEHRIWRHTKQVAKYLGLWNKQLYTIIKEYCYASELIY